eukprot:g16106.t1
MSAVSEARETAVAETVERIRALEAEGGVTRETLAKIKEALIALGLRSELFPEEDFPPPESGTGDRLYRLSMDSDDRFALYLNRGTGDKDTPPHDHTTWACVVGVRGQEHNKFYRRTDDGASPGRGTVEVVAEKTVEPGTGVAMTPDDIHSIHMRGPEAKKLLAKKSVDFVEYDIWEEAGRKEEMVERSGGATTVPQIFIDGRPIGGCDELMTLEARGELDRLLETAADLVREAAGRGAQLVGLPEVVNLMQVNRKEAVAAARTEEEDESLAGFRTLARELGIWLHVGSLSLKIAGEERLANRGFLIDPKGAIRGRYDKIHMPGALACAAARAGDRERLFRLRPGADRRA